MFRVEREAARLAGGDQGASMTQRERQGTGGPATPPLADRLSLAALPARNGEVAPNWDELFPALSPAQQRTLLALTTEQGVVNARQIPTANGAADPARLFFAPLLHGHGIDQLPPVPLTRIDPVDTALSEEQRLAVAK